VVERQPSKLNVEGSNPFARFFVRPAGCGDPPGVRVGTGGGEALERANGAGMGAGSDALSTVERIKVLLRRDLKLGQDAVIADDMALAGGEFDLDSLDMLLLITSLEKEFGVRIVEGSIKREAFASVAALAAFIESALAGRRG
jgi:acyl carrier protein